MLHVVSKLIVVLAALSSTAPADYCLLKLMGRCCKSAHVSNHDLKSSCCLERVDDDGHDDLNAKSACKQCGSPLEKNGHERKSCCAFTPSDGVLSQTAIFTAADAHSELPPRGPIDGLAHLALCAPPLLGASTGFAACHHPQAADAPLFLLVHAFLI